MKNWRNWIVVLALVAYVILFWWWASSGFLLEGQICEPTNPPSNCDFYNVFLYSAWRFAKAADHWSALIAAVFTVVLAVFTGRLWYSTEGLFRVTKIVADADRPHMVPSEFKISGIRSAVGDDGNIKTSFTYRFVNYGRSPAFMRRFSFVVRVAEGPMPEVPEYGEMTPTDYIIPVSGWWGSADPSIILVRQADAIAILADTAALVIYGLLEYGDPAGQTHKIRFAYKFSFGEGDVSERFRPTGPDSYREYT